MSHPNPTDTERGTERIEAFSDGVFAIAITLLILDVRVPRTENTAHATGLFATLIGLWPSYLAYLLSFVMIGIYWANHHYVFKLFSKTNHTLNLLNLLFLLTISFLPFPTATLGSFLLIEEDRTIATAFYALGLLLPALTWLLIWLYATTNGRLVGDHVDPRFLHRLTMQYGITVVIYTGTVLLSLIDFRIGLGLCVGLTLLYLLPPASLAAWHMKRASRQRTP